MQKPEFAKAMKLAHSLEIELPAYLSIEMETAIGGCALDKQRRWVRIEHVASLIRGHCLTFNGTWDYTELAEIETWAKRFDVITKGPL